MYKNLLFAALLFAGGRLYADIGVEIDAGLLRDNTATHNLEPVTGLLQLVALPSGGGNPIFPAPAPGSFQTGGDVILQNFGMNYFNGAGETDNTFTLFTANLTGVPVGTPLLLRWWPNITLMGGTPSRNPMAGDMYGEYRSNVAEYSGANPWTLPADPTQKIVFAFNTSDVNGGGPNAPSAGYATFSVASTPVPEPSTYALLGLGIGGLILGVLRRRPQVS